MINGSKFYEFPSPINGVSFKQENAFISLLATKRKFPSPINGVSFKL